MASSVYKVDEIMRITTQSNAQR